MVLVVDNHNKNISKMKRPQVRFESCGLRLKNILTLHSQSP